MIYSDDIFAHYIVPMLYAYNDELRKIYDDLASGAVAMESGPDKIAVFDTANKYWARAVDITDFLTEVNC